MYSYVSSFGIAMNEGFWNALPPDLQAVMQKSFVGVESEIGEVWDGLDGPGKKALSEGGGEAIMLSPEEDAKFRKIGAQVAAAKVKGLDATGQPGSEVYQMLKSLAEKHSKTSKNFWN